MSLLRRGRASVLIAVAVGLAAGGIAYGSIPGPNGVIHGCYAKTNGQLRVTDGAVQCNKSETTLNWNQQGSVGPTGPTGPTGPAATRLWASAQTFFGGTCCSRLYGTATSVTYGGSAGEYKVTFAQDVTQCAANVTPNRGVNEGYAANLTGWGVTGIVAHEKTDPDSLFVTFFDTSGEPAQPFGLDISVFC